jgi:hypothetical protein
MKSKINSISAAIIIALAIGITAYAHGPARGFSSDYSMSGHGYAMMGGHGMMGGYGSGNGMMGGYGYNGDGYDRDSWHQNRQNSRDYRQNNTKYRERAESLINEIDEKRQELSSLIRSKNADKALIDQKIDDLNRLEKSLDDMMR